VAYNRAVSNAMDRFANEPIPTARPEGSHDLRFASNRVQILQRSPIIQFFRSVLIVIVVAIAGLTFGQEAVRGEVSAQLQDLLGAAGAQAVIAMLVGASKPMEGILATVLGAQPRRFVVGPARRPP